MLRNRTPCLCSDQSWPHSTDDWRGARVHSIPAAFDYVSKQGCVAYSRRRHPRTLASVCRIRLFNAYEACHRGSCRKEHGFVTNPVVAAGAQGLLHMLHVLVGGQLCSSPIALKTRATPSDSNAAKRTSGRSFAAGESTTKHPIAVV